MFHLVATAQFSSVPIKRPANTEQPTEGDRKKPKLQEAAVQTISIDVVSKSKEDHTQVFLLHLLNIPACDANLQVQLEVRNVVSDLVHGVENRELEEKLKHSQQSLENQKQEFNRIRAQHEKNQATLEKARQLAIRFRAEKVAAEKDNADLRVGRLPFRMHRD